MVRDAIESHPDVLWVAEQNDGTRLDVQVAVGRADAVVDDLTSGAIDDAQQTRIEDVRKRSETLVFIELET